MVHPRDEDVTARRASRALLGGMVFVSFLLVMAAPASAHASLQETAPGADQVVTQGPDEVELRFDEPVDASLGGVNVTAPDGHRVDYGTARTSDGGRVVRAEVDAVEKGSYLVEWSVLSEDGHQLRGSFVFSVGTASSVAPASTDEHRATRLLAGAARLVGYAGTLLLIGALVLATLDSRRRPLSTIAAFGAAGASIAGIVLLLTQAALASGRPLLDAFGLVGPTLETRTGWFSGVRVLVGASAVGVALVWRRAGHRAFVVVLGALTVALAAVPALSGHAWTTDPRVLAVGTDIAHLMATGAWVGGLAAIAASTRGAVALRDRLRAFSPIAAWGLAATVATGVLSSWLQTRSVAAVTDTGYGQVLVLKVVLVAAVVAGGVVNRRLLAGIHQPLRRCAVAGELACALLILAVTAALVNQPPARDTVARPINVTAETTGDFEGSIEVQVQPARAGANDVHVYFFDSKGLPRRIDIAEVLVGRPGQAPRPVEVTPLTRDHVSAYGVTFPTPGTWEITVTSLTVGLASSATVEVTVR